MDFKQKAILELDRLKTVMRNSYISDGTRRENSAEHSWHLAVTLLSLSELMPNDLDLDHAIRIALIHDICEIGAGDVSVYDINRSAKSESEAEYMDLFKSQYGNFGSEAEALWREYEEQQSIEGRWVKLADRMLPFILNLATKGRVWQERGISRSQVLKVNLPINSVYPEIYEWMKMEIDSAVEKGWLKDA
jgi:putative hydrolase of HD superfamily